MSTPRSVRVTNEHESCIEDMVDRGIADSGSEAHRLLLNEGMRQYGYAAGECRDTRLKWLCREFARAFAWVGIAWLALTLFFPVGFRVGAIFAVWASLGCVVLLFVLDRHEPAVSQRIARICRGESA